MYSARAIGPVPAPTHASLRVRLSPHVHTKKRGMIAYIPTADAVAPLKLLMPRLRGASAYGGAYHLPSPLDAVLHSFAISSSGEDRANPGERYAYGDILEHSLFRVATCSSTARAFLWLDVAHSATEEASRGSRVASIAKKHGVRRFNAVCNFALKLYSLTIRARDRSKPNQKKERAYTCTRAMAYHFQLPTVSKWQVTRRDFILICTCTSVSTQR